MRWLPPQSWAISACTELARPWRSALSSQTTPVRAEMNSTSTPTSTNLNDGERTRLAKNPGEGTERSFAEVALPWGAVQGGKYKSKIRRDRGGIHRDRANRD